MMSITILRRSITAAVVLGLVSLVGVVQAQEEPTAVAKLTALLADAHTIDADFTQLTLDSSGVRIQESRGHMSLKRPGKFTWHTQEPMQQELVSDGKTVWLYDPDLMQVTIQKLDERMTHTPALLLSGDMAQIEESFFVEYQQNRSIVDFVLTPKAKDTLFDRLRLSFRDGLINDMQLEDAVGQKTNLYFFDLKMNTAMDDALFRFNVPKGVDVIEE